MNKLFENRERSVSNGNDLKKHKGLDGLMVTDCVKTAAPFHAGVRRTYT